MATDFDVPQGSFPIGETIRVRGVVQGVGFRPAVWRLARDCGLAGDVSNDAEGVLIHAFGAASACDLFLRRLRTEAPPLARIDALETASLGIEGMPAEFAIAASGGGDVHTAIVADAASCAACLDDIRDAHNRRYRYAFANCTHCGPRLSIVRGVPYDRANTSMQAFELCEACRAEYENPEDRRFHAQPNACPHCGPALWLEASGEAAFDPAGDPVEAAQHLLRAGLVVAIKGIGGIHLACDAGNELAVARLRQRKQRLHKPLALMARDVTMIRRYCAVSDAEAALLDSSAAPIVLLDARGSQQLAASVAPAQQTLGFMLPYSPLHHLLMAELETPIVLTSGNRSAEPQCVTNDSAREKLTGIADAFLLHNRNIVNRLDDSVLRIVRGTSSVLRRARGYAPASLKLPAGFEAAQAVLACGGELKSTFCLLEHGEAVLSQHLGDLENAAANAAWRDTLALYLKLFEHRPRTLAVDRHPEYLASKFGRQEAAARALPLVVVQHHHAHIAACLADNAIPLEAAPLLGIALDGIGYGDDDTLWGGEFLLADYRGARRLASFAPVPMPGGVQAIREPWRMGYAHLRRLGAWPRLAECHATLPYFRALDDRPLGTLEGMLQSDLNCPLTSSCGRLFDAVAAVVGLCQTATYEGQAAIELEAAVDATALGDAGYPFFAGEYKGLPVLEPAPMWESLLCDLRAGVPRGVIAARFHSGLAVAVASTVDRLADACGNAWRGRIALSGGVFQNVVLTTALCEQLEDRGLTVYRHARVPANDGGLSLGQAVVAAARSIESSRRDKVVCV